MFGAISYGFLYWIFFGATLVLIILGALEWFKDKGIGMKWWKWIVLTLWYIALMVSVGAPFTLMGEGETGAGWKLLGVNAVVIIIAGFLVYRILLMSKKKQEKEV